MDRPALTGRGAGGPGRQCSQQREPKCADSATAGRGKGGRCDRRLQARLGRREDRRPGHRSGCSPKIAGNPKESNVGWRPRWKKEVSPRQAG